MNRKFTNDKQLFTAVRNPSQSSQMFSCFFFLYYYLVCVLYLRKLRFSINVKLIKWPSICRHQRQPFDPAASQPSHEHQFHVTYLFPVSWFLLWGDWPDPWVCHPLQQNTTTQQIRNFKDILEVAAGFASWWVRIHRVLPPSPRTPTSTHDQLAIKCLKFIVLLTRI